MHFIRLLVHFLVSDNGPVDENQYTCVPLHTINAEGVLLSEFEMPNPALIESGRIQSYNIFEWR